MIHLSASELQRPPSEDGFAWWYCDITDGRGGGVVVIASVGLPFVPVRSGDPRGALQRPSLSVSVYRDGREAFYLLTTARPEASTWDVEAGVYRLGDSELRFEDASGDVRFTASLDAQLPGGGRLTGDVELRGPRCTTRASGSEGGGPLAWCPVATTCSARARLRVDEVTRLDLDGRGYLDGNRSDVPLHRLGIDEWRWGRLALPERELVYFHVASPSGPPRLVLVEVTPDGSIAPLPSPTAAFAERRPTLYGLRRAATLELSSAGRRVASLRYDHLVDDGPFYQRYLVTGVDAAGVEGHGIAERVVPGRVGIGWQRPFIEMRVQREGEAGSRWLPLFSGERSGRWSRLLSSWARRPVAP